MNAVELTVRGLRRGRCWPLRQPVDFFRAPRGLLDAAPLYPESARRRMGRADAASSSSTTSPTSTTTPIVMSEAGAGSVTPVIRARIEATDTQEGAS